MRWKFFKTGPTPTPPGESPVSGVSELSGPCTGVHAQLIAVSTCAHTLVRKRVKADNVFMTYIFNLIINSAQACSMLTEKAGPDPRAGRCFVLLPGRLSPASPDRQKPALCLPVGA